MTFKHILNLIGIVTLGIGLTACSHTGKTVHDHGDEMVDAMEHVHHDMTIASDSSSEADVRLMDLVNRWFSLKNDSSKPIESFFEILAADFNIVMPDVTISDFGQFVRWYEKYEPVGSSTVTNFSQQSVGGDQYNLQFDVDHGGKVMKHSWTVIDNPRRPYANIVRMDVQEVIQEASAE